MEEIRVKIFKKKVEIPKEGYTDRFVISPMGLKMNVSYTKIQIGKIPVLAIRLTVNDAISISVDFAIDYLKDKEGYCDRILLINLFSPKVTRQILEGWGK